MSPLRLIRNVVERWCRTRIEKAMLRWFGHIKRINVRKITTQIHRASVEENVEKGWPQCTYFNQAQDVLIKGEVKSTKCEWSTWKVCQERSGWWSILFSYSSEKLAQVYVWMYLYLVLWFWRLLYKGNETVSGCKLFICYLYFQQTNVSAFLQIP